MKKLFGVRSVVQFPGEGDRSMFEERITVWHAEGHDEAIGLATAEVDEYVEDISGTDTSLYQSYEIYPLEGDFPDGAEVFSLIRESSLDPDSYLERYFSTGDEREELMD